MAITLTAAGRGAHVHGDQQVRYFDVALDTSYPTGGYVFGANEAGLRNVDHVLVHNANGYNCQYDYTNGKIKVFQGDNANAAAAPGIEVPNATNLSAVTLRVRVEGY